MLIDARAGAEVSEHVNKESDQNNKSFNFHDCRWQFLLSLELLIAILGGEFEYGYYMLLRFATCAAFVFWAFEAYDQARTPWGHTLALSGDGSKCTTQGRLKVYHPGGVGA